jgi:Transposase
MSNIAQAREDVDRSVRAAREAVETATTGTAEQAERAVWAALLALGRSLMALFFALRAARYAANDATYTHAGLTYQLTGHEVTEVGTLFGKVERERPVGRVVGAPRWARDLPLDRELGLAGGFTLPVVMMLARLCAQMAFASVRDLFRSLFDWSPSSRSVLRMVDAAGAQVRPFVEEAPPPEADGEVLVITVDGKGAPAISSVERERRAQARRTRDSNARHARREERRRHPRPRRAPGKKSKNAKVAAVGVMYTLRRTEDGRLEGPVNKRLYATFESFRALFEWIHREAKRRGYGTQKFRKVLFVADGADTIWALQKEYFPDAAVCIDWYHIVEKLWAAGKAICRGTRRRRRALETWVAEQKRRLRKGQLREVLTEIQRALSDTSATGPGNKFRRKVLGDVLAHFTKNAARMRYAELRRQDFDIGSGVVEGAVRNLVGVRLDGPGMRWGRDRSEAVLHLRSVLLNGQWKEFERHIAARPIRLAAQPVPARTHDAVLKKAA